MKICPNCTHQEIEGALFCSECAANLFDSAYSGSNDAEGNQFLTNEFSKEELLGEVNTRKFDSLEAVCFQLIHSGVLLHLSKDHKMIIGRSVNGQPLLPDIDLTPYDGFENGVSRVHGEVLWNDDEILITDLDSANGTRVNDIKIAAFRPFPVKLDDIIVFGRLQVKITTCSNRI